MTITTTTATSGSAASSIGALCNGGSVVVYSGTPPANANAALSGNTALATGTFSATAFGAPSGNVITANTITTSTVAATGTATFFRALKSDGTTVVFQGSAGTSGTDMTLNTTSLVAGANYSITSCTLTGPT